MCRNILPFYIPMFLPSICCMRSIVWNKCTAPAVSPPSTIPHHHSWHFGIKSNVRSVLSLSHSKSNQCNVDIGGRRYLSALRTKRFCFLWVTEPYPDSRNPGLQSKSYQKQWVFGNFCLVGAFIFPRFTLFYPTFGIFWLIICRDVKCSQKNLVRRARMECGVAGLCRCSVGRN